MKTPLEDCGASRPGESLYTRGEMATRANRHKLIPLLAVVGFTALGAWQALVPTPDLRGGPRRGDIPPNEGVLAIGYLLQEARLIRSPVTPAALAAPPGTAPHLRARDDAIPQDPSTLQVLR